MHQFNTSLSLSNHHFFHVFYKKDKKREKNIVYKTLESLHFLKYRKKDSNFLLCECAKNPQ